MNKKLKNILEQLSPGQLIQVICQAHASSRETQPVIEQAIAAYDPKELYKLTNKAITSVKNGARFIDYRGSFEFADKLDQINQGIEQLITQAPDQAIKLCQRFIDIDGSICERVDDSSGFLTDCYTTTYELLDRAFVGSKTDPEVVGNYLYKVYSQDEYGLRGYILENCKQSLRAGADKVLETLLQNHPLEDYKTDNALKTIADVRGDVDAYIALIQKEEQRFQRPLSPQSILEISKLLNVAFRSEEAITWLNKIEDDSHHYSQKIQLLIDAYRLEGKDNEARRLLWERFERYLHAKDYFAYLKHASETEREAATTKAIDLAKIHQHLSSALTFLADIHLWDEVEILILQHAKADTLNGSDYSRYRKLSTALANHKKDLAATLLRRALVEDVLYKAQSKYYHYGVSDLKKARDFAEDVTDWQDFESHQAFMQSLQTQHARKHAFWSKVDDAGFLLK